MRILEHEIPVKASEQKAREEQSDLLAIEPVVSARNFVTRHFQKIYDEVEDWIGKYDTPIQWENAGISPVDRRLRIRLWNEIQDCIRQGRSKVVTAKVLNGEITHQHFARLMRTKIRAAYIFTKPLDHNEIAMTMLEESYVELKKILDLDIICKKSGRPISTLINSKIRIHQILADRALGQTIQRIEQHSVVETKKSLRSVADINEELMKLESESREDSSLVLEANEDLDSQTQESQNSQPTSLQSQSEAQCLDDET